MNREYVVIAGAGVLLLVFFFYATSAPPLAGDEVSLSCVGVDRSSYGVSPAVFELLPPPPSCVVSAGNSFGSGSFTDGSFFGPDYYLQPEFYPSFFSEGISQWTNPSLTHYGAVGFSAHPFSRSLVLGPGESTTVRFFLRSGFGVRSFQEGALYLVSENPGLVMGSLDENSTRSIVLGPTFPQFYPDWVHPVDVQVRVAPSVPSGVYTVTVYTAAVAPGDQRFFPLPGEFYQSFTDFVGSRPVFTVQVRVP